MEFNDLVPVYSVADPTHAAIIKNALNAEGIRSFVDGANQAGEAGLITLKVKILVRAGDADRARKFIEHHEKQHLVG